MKRILPFGLLMLFLLAACAGPAANRPAAETPPDITVFRAPT